ncbi:MAG: hypothetical protein K0R65_2359 [Crocinitomicaceae bacterium]|jgi:hypothetical protein|nr:hypothetical protein [Crocinitomicaceae bacterium]
MRQLSEDSLNPDKLYFARYYTNHAIRTYFVILLIIASFSVTNISPPIWLIFSTCTVLLFFIFLNRISMKWNRYSDAFFRKKLFRTALIIRIIVILGLYFFFDYMTGQPFEFDAGDSIFYDETGQFMADYIQSGKLNLFDELQKYMVISDTGFPVYLGAFYAITFKSLIVVRLFNAFLGAWLCVMVYDFTKRNFNEQIARLTAIMMMILPALLYYAGLHLKETLMIFLLFACLNLADIILKSKHVSYLHIVLLVISGSSLFLFRTVLGACAIFAIISCIIFTSRRITGMKRKFVIAFWLLGAFAALMTTSVKQDLYTYINEGSSNQEQKISSVNNAQGNKLAKYGSKTLLFPLLIPAPFPTFVDTGQKNIMMLGGSIFIRNIYAFFVILGLIMLYKKRLYKTHVLAISFLLSYMVVLGFSGFVLSDRFHLPLVPVLLMLAAYGISEVTKRNYRYFNLYLILVGGIIIGWNWFKLAGRDLF